MRNCYAAALHAGAHPADAPSYRDGECTVFNAAIEDLDGNVISFVFRERGDSEEEGEGDAAVSVIDNSRVLTWQKDVAASGLHDDVQSLSSRVSRDKSRAQTAMDLASQAAGSIRSRSAAPAPGISRSYTTPAISSTTDFPSKAFLGTILGAAAGATIAWAMTKAEHENERVEAAFEGSMRSQRSVEDGQSTVRPRRNYSVTESHAPRSHRNYSTTESQASRRYPPRSLARSMRAIEPASAAFDDADVQDILSRYTASRRPLPATRSRTLDAADYASLTSSYRHLKRSTTLPVEDDHQYLLEAPKPRSIAPSHRSSSSRARDADKSTRSTASHHATGRRSHHHHEDEGVDQDLKRRDSGISMRSSSHRSSHAGSLHRSSHRPPSASTVVAGSSSSSSRRSSASTIKTPPRHGTSLNHHESAVNVPLPPSRTASSYVSVTSAKASSVKAPSYVTAAQVPIPSSHGNGWTQEEPWPSGAEEESDGLGDTKTVVPDDSISCVNISVSARSQSSRHRSQRTSKGGSRASGRDSDRKSDATVRPIMRKRGEGGGSAASLPVRAKEEYYRHDEGRPGKRSTVSYA